MKERITRFLCRRRGHRWRVIDYGGHVHAGDDWDGQWCNDHPWSFGVQECRRCGRQESL